MILYTPPGLGQTPTQVQQMIQTAAAGYSVPGLSAVAQALAMHESGDNPAAQNPGSSAAGVFQLISSTQSTLGVTNPLDAQQNVNAGVGLLASYYQKYGNWPDALQAFSDGPGTVAQGLPPSSQTTGLLAYIQTNTGLDFSGSDDSNPISDELASIGVQLPDLSQDTLIPGVPDWLTWLGAAGLIAGAVVWSQS